MKLAIISDCLHYKTSNGIGSANHIFVRQMNFLSCFFEKTTLCVPVTKDEQKSAALSYYDNRNICFIETPLVIGGNKIKDKLHIIKFIPVWLKAFNKLKDDSDIFYLRYPSSVSLVGFFYFTLFKRKLFASYAGIWGNYDVESYSFKFQRFLLRNFFAGPVFVYSHSGKQDKKCIPTISPSYTMKEWEEETKTVSNKLINVNNYNFDDNLLLLSVGSLEKHKNHIFLLNSILYLEQQGVKFTLYIVGEGTLKPVLKDFVRDNKLESRVHFTGHIKQDDLKNLYRIAHFVIQPSIVEGFGKVPLEGMFFGVIPVLSNKGFHPYFIGRNNERGSLFNLDDPSNVVECIMSITNNKRLWRQMINNGRTFAKQHTLECWGRTSL